MTDRAKIDPATARDPHTLSREPPYHALLLLLAHVGPLLADHAWSLWHDVRRIRAPARHVTLLRQAGLITIEHLPSGCGHWRQQHAPGGPARWMSLTPTGWAALRAADPELGLAAPVGMGDRLTQRLWTDLVIRMLGMVPTMPGLVGLSVTRCWPPAEQPLPTTGQVVLRRWRSTPAVPLQGGLSRVPLPWLRTPATPEQEDWTAMVVVDPGIGDGQCLMQQAQVMQAAHAAAGAAGLPAPILWVAPDSRRLRLAAEAWAAGWPTAPILLTAWDGLTTSGVRAPIWHRLEGSKLHPLLPLGRLPAWQRLPAAERSRRC